MLKRAAEKGASFYAWAVRHKLVSVGVLIAAVVMLINIFSGASESLKGQGESGIERSELDALESTIFGFADEYGCFSYIDCLDTSGLEMYAHKDLAVALARERISPYLLPEEAASPEGAQAIAAARMQQLGAVRVTRVEEVEVLSHEGESFQIGLSVTAFYFSNQEGLSEREERYTLDLEKAAGAGISSPYVVVRFLKD